MTSPKGAGNRNQLEQPEAGHPFGQGEQHQPRDLDEGRRRAEARPGGAHGEPHQKPWSNPGRREGRRWSHPEGARRPARPGSRTLAPRRRASITTTTSGMSGTTSPTRSSEARGTVGHASTEHGQGPATRAPYSAPGSEEGRPRPGPLPGSSPRSTSSRRGEIERRGSGRRSERGQSRDRRWSRTRPMGIPARREAAHARGHHEVAHLAGSRHPAP